jgi:hypothetical protein
MPTKSRACVVVLLVITCGGSRAVGQTGWSFIGNYSYVVEGLDDYHLIPQDLKFGFNSVGPNGQVSFSSPEDDSWSANEGDQKASGAAVIKGKVGSFHLLASAIASSNRTQDFLPLNRVRADATVSASLELKDSLTFKDPKHPGTRLVTANWNITNDSDLITIATGVTSPHGFDPNGNYDNVVGQAEAFFNASGTGVPNAPAIPPPNGGVADTSLWAYSYKIRGGIIEPTIDQLEYDSPASIPVSFLATPGRPLFVKWDFGVTAKAIVNNFDLNMGSGLASSLGDYGHTITWGGITSVVDADTGEPDTDWSVESASGFDYAHAAPEPEPASIVLAAIGSIAVAAVARCKSTASNRDS